jgi:crossover junction endodeoxyribonuclease RuvC
MRILGIDPGSRVTGWGVLDSSGWDMRLVALGAIRAGDGGPLGNRLVRIMEALRQVIVAHGPDVVAIEEVFTAKNARAALVLGHARGVALLAAGEAGLSIHEYAPTQVKRAVTGSGRAEKAQVQAALAVQLAMREPPRPIDASDALAVALCHAATARFTARVSAADDRASLSGLPRDARDALTRAPRRGRLRLT